MIRFTSMIFGQLVVVLGLAAVGCAGADDAGPSPAKPFDSSACNWDGDVPDGSYWYTCDDCAIENATLRCVCTTESGAKRDAKLALTQCVTNISNENGVLVEHAEPGADASQSGAEISGACDLRLVNQSCIQYTGTAAELEPEEEACVGKGGTWSTDKCPAPSDDGGCCSYEGHHACGYTHDAYFDQMDPCFAKDECSCDVG